MSRGTLGALLVAGLGLGCVHGVRAGLARDFSHVRQRYDIHSLPSPERAVVFSMGYRSALADLLFAGTLVESGLHLQAHRPFETVVERLDVVLKLDPKLATVYRFADTLVTFQARGVGRKEYFAARRLLEQGMRELPYDGELYLSAGQFMAYVAPPNLLKTESPEVVAEWRSAGARAMVRACELSGGQQNIAFQCVTAASLLRKSGEVEALERFVERVLAVTDDPEIQRQALTSLERATSEHRRELMSQRRDRSAARKKADIAFVKRDLYLLLPPPSDVWRCLAPGASDAACAQSGRSLQQATEGRSGQSL